ncbi:helix-turn-helix domain-containing protein [Streptomyces sp. S.PB5]|uniref:AraC family transcriptional regulator n=1 Tax=Streptomyces sp. S.PB5 TaxID=3020844 RepID=UPI0025B19ED7|nr:helix-turn-helix domain-containing protein [Streptomyces sp. S.PB5]MDN3021809.1 helix-turn-helix domain-containing protein [Streptomyces sp. S.PB5]
MTTTARAEPAPLPPLSVPDALRPWIAQIATVTGGESVAHTPDTATKLVVRVGEDGRRDALVVGPRTRASYHRAGAERLASCVQLHLAPGTARPLLGVAAADLVGRVVPLRELPTRTARQLSYAAAVLETDELIDRLAHTLARLPLPDSRGRLLRAAVDALSIRADRIPGQVKDVARELAVSERQLRNLFAEGVGLSPKHYARIDRVRAVLAQAPTAKWADLAATTGYYDQAHMTSDFRTLMGVPPRSFFTGRLPEARPCQAFDRLSTRPAG